jgi:hypothetical protein
MTIKQTTNLGSAGRAPSLWVIPWHLPCNWGKKHGKPSILLYNFLGFKLRYIVGTAWLVALSNLVCWVELITKLRHLVNEWLGHCMILHFVTALERMSEVSSIYAHCKCEIEYGNILLLSGHSVFHLGTSPLSTWVGRGRAQLHL